MWWRWRHSWNLTTVHLPVKTWLLVGTHLLRLWLAVLSHLLRVLMTALVPSLRVLSATRSTLWALITWLGSPLGCIVEFNWFSKYVMALALRDALRSVLLLTKAKKSIPL